MARPAQVNVQFRFDAVNDYLQEMKNFAGTDLVSQFIQDNFNDLQEIVRRNNRRIWQTKGESIDENWGDYQTTGKGRSGKVRVEGRPVTLVDTGELLASMVSADLIQQGTRVYWQSDVDYARYVDERYTIYGVDDMAMDEISTLFDAWFQNEITRIGTQAATAAASSQDGLLRRVASFFGF